MTRVLLSPLGLLNFVFLQWFFVRLARVVDETTGETTTWTLLGPVWPLSGWWSPYRWLRRRPRRS